MKKTPKNSDIFLCEKCDFKCCKNNEWQRHLATTKHQNGVFLNDLEQKNSNCAPKYACKKCNKIYSVRNSLWYHEQKCQNNKVNDEPEILTENTKIDQSNKDNLIEYLIKENAEFKTLIMELVKKDSISTSNSNNISINNINSNNNNTFNLQFFLNEQCKDALNIGEFIDSIKVQLSDLENTGRVGYVEGVSKILIKNLNELDTCKRPIHCSDLKREVLYIKDNDKWSKEDDNKCVIKKAIKDVANKNIRQITEWANLNPDCKKSDSKKNNQYLNIVMNSMSGGSNEEQSNNIEKIVKNITKTVVIEK